MKKTLFALAALAATSASFAQSSVTLYGVLDASLESVKGDKTVTRVSSSNLNYSAVGVKGSEDLGSGLKASFNLEAPISLDTGSSNATQYNLNNRNGQSTPTTPSTQSRFWAYESWVGLSGSFGGLKLGRTETPIGDIALHTLGAQPYDDLYIVGSRAAVDHVRADNAVTYDLPTMVPGMSATLQYSTGSGTATTAGVEQAGSNYGKSYGLNIKYAAGPLSAGIGYNSMKDDSLTAGDQKANATLAYGAFDFGVAKLTGYYDAETNLDNIAGDRRMTLVGVKVAVPVADAYTVVAGFSKARNVYGSAAGDDNVEIMTLRGIYQLSKRTSVYAMFTNVNNGRATMLAPASADVSIADKTTHGIAVGVSHSF
jgi:predicted porin